jgi:hypothetical protein
LPSASVIGKLIADRRPNFRLKSKTGIRIRAMATVSSMPRSPLNSVQIPANANKGRSSFNANQTTSFLPVSGFGSGAYYAKLLTGTRQRLSGLSQPLQ